MIYDMWIYKIIVSLPSHAIGYFLYLIQLIHFFIINLQTVILYVKLPLQEIMLRGGWEVRGYDVV